MVPWPAILKEDSTLTLEQRRQALAAAGLLHPHPDLVVARLFVSDNPFFFALDKVQVKYEMLRAHLVDGLPSWMPPANMATRARPSTWWPRRSTEEGMLGLLDDKRGRHGPLKVTPEIDAYVRSAQQLSGAALSEEVAERFGVVLHRRTLERLRRT